MGTGSAARLNLLSSNVLVRALAQHLTVLCIHDMDVHLSRDQFSAICQLQRLRVLVIKTMSDDLNAGLEAVYPEITGLCNLERLGVGCGRDILDGKPVKLTTALTQLGQLTHLSFNGTEDCFPILTPMPNLLSLKLSDLPDDLALPPSFGALTTLTFLSLHFITLLPSVHSLSQLLNLKSLSCTCVHTTDPNTILCKPIGHLTSLTSLTLNECYLELLDFNHFSSLHALAELSLEQLELDELIIPWGLDSLTSLNACINNLTCMPLNLARLPALCELDVSLQHHSFQVLHGLDWMLGMSHLSSVALTQSGLPNDKDDEDIKSHVWTQESMYHLAHAHERMRCRGSDTRRVISF